MLYMVLGCPFGSVLYQREFRLVQNQSENCRYNPISVNESEVNKHKFLEYFLTRFAYPADTLWA